MVQGPKFSICKYRIYHTNLWRKKQKKRDNPCEFEANVNDNGSRRSPMESLRVAVHPTGVLPIVQVTLYSL